MSLFTKPLKEVDWSLVEALVGVASESQSLEFKVGLPVKRGTSHPWEQGDRKIDDHARDEILKEIVAMATADGGHLVIGIAEAKGSNKVATAIKAIPDCKKLADMFRQFSRDHIDTHIVGIEWFGIANPSGSGEGVVVARIPQSQNAPHRVKGKKEFYIRRDEDSLPMSVQEIKDAVFRSAVRFDEIKKRLDSRRGWMDELLATQNQKGLVRVAMRVTTLPTHGNVNIRRVYEHEELFPALRELKASAEGKTLALEILSEGRQLRVITIAPILQGGRRKYRSDDGASEFSQEVFADGLAELRFDFEPNSADIAPIYFNSFGGILANALLMAQAVRNFAAIPESEFVVDVEIGSSIKAPTVVDFEDRRYEGVGSIERGNFEQVRVQFPQYTVVSQGEFSERFADIINDIRSAAGLKAIDGLSVNFD